MIRAITHIHTNYSYDSRLLVPRLLKALLDRQIGLALVADHDSFQGAIDLAAEVRRTGAAILAPLAAEIATEFGDVVVVLPDGVAPPEVKALKKWADLKNTVRQMRGLIWLPHPYQHHREIETMAAEADVIEVFNSRCTPDNNAAAQELCRRFGKIAAYGADAHSLVECFRTVVEYPPAATAIEILSQSPRCLSQGRTPHRAIVWSQIVKGFKQRRPKLIVLTLLAWLPHPRRKKH
jgi:predicted metal-dependent phosphoesterase TrpH